MSTRTLDRFAVAIAVAGLGACTPARGQTLDPATSSFASRSFTTYQPNAGVNVDQTITRPVWSSVPADASATLAVTSAAATLNLFGRAQNTLGINGTETTNSFTSVRALGRLDATNSYLLGNSTSTITSTTSFSLRFTLTTAQPYSILITTAADADSVLSRSLSFTRAGGSPVASLNDSAINTSTRSFSGILNPGGYVLTFSSSVQVQAFAPAQPLTVGGNVDVYFVVPAPSSAAVLAGAGVLLARRRRAAASADPLTAAGASR